MIVSAIPRTGKTTAAETRKVAMDGGRIFLAGKDLTAMTEARRRTAEDADSKS